MAVTKEIPNPYSTEVIPAAYIRWAALYIEPIAETLRAVFNVYYDQESRDAGIKPIDQIVYTVDSHTTPSYAEFTGGQTGAADSIGQLVYDFAKSQPELEGATDV